MAKRYSYMAWCLLILLLSACAGHVENKRFVLDAETAPIFSGLYKHDVFLEGNLKYQDLVNSEFDGKFDSLGYPLLGELRQSYLDTNNDTLLLTLSGNFSVNIAQSSLSFTGAFTITDSEHNVLAQGTQSQWSAPYSDLNPLRAPPLMAMTGDNKYLQYRRNISPKGRLEAYPIVHRNLAGPFLLEAGFREGLPRGVIKISAQNSEQVFFVVERQYFNYQILPQPIQYFYYEPGSFSSLALLGDCERAPNLTVPQQLLQAFAYDCDKGEFYALSEDYPASVLQISAKDIDNGGIFHRLRIYRHGKVTDAAVNVDALYDGKWLYHGPVTSMHYGSLESYRRYDLGKPIGIGIQAGERGAKYISFGRATALTGAPPALPDDDLRDRLDSRYEWYKQRLNTRFSTALRDTILSQSELAKLKSVLLQDIEENKPLAKDGQVAGLPDLWQSWQRRNAARLSTWNNSSGYSAAVMKAQILTDLDKWYSQSGVLLLQESAQRCARIGQSFNDRQGRCENRPDQALQEICKRYFDESQCAAMSTAFTNAAIAH
tara:strand:- start:819 stop:2453 length:1635 start_codon:yes stop_codon:yes gene_type:complete